MRWVVIGRVRILMEGVPTDQSRGNSGLGEGGGGAYVVAMVEMGWVVVVFAPVPVAFWLLLLRAISGESCRRRGTWPRGPCRRCALFLWWWVMLLLLFSTKRRKVKRG